MNELIARNTAAAPPVPVSSPAAVPITMPSDRWIVALLGLALAFIVWIVWLFWLERTKGVRLAETTGGYQEAMEQASMTTSVPTHSFASRFDDGQGFVGSHLIRIQMFVREH